MQIQYGRAIKLIVCAGFFVVIGLTIAVSDAQAAASLYLNPAEGTFEVGSTFSVSILLDSGDQSVNAIEANLSFPADKLQIVPSASTGNSIIKIWVTQPNYSNSNGTIKLQGAVPNPGIKTSSGQISTLTFRVKDVGNAAIRFLDSSKVFLNDGKATNILANTSGGIYTLSLPPPEGPEVTSKSNPDQGRWYQNKVIVFEWVAPEDLQGYSYLLDEDPGTIPDNISEGPNTRISFDTVGDGVHYFHIRSLRQNVWGGVTSYEVKIDRTPPAEFPIDILPSDYTARKIPIISFSTTDGLSGFDHFEIATISIEKEGGNKNESPLFVEVAPPSVNPLEVGRYRIFVRAFDKAGNYTQVDAPLTIVNPILEIIGIKGIRLGGTLMVGWPHAAVGAIIILIVLFVLARFVWNLHARIEERLRHGPSAHPAIAPRLDELRHKQEEYGSGASKKLLAFIGIICIGAGLLLSDRLTLAAGGIIEQETLEPPLITLFPKSPANDEIVYVGGTVNVPGSSMVVYLQHTEDHATTAHTVIADGKGNWFYSFPDFFESGHASSPFPLWNPLRGMYS